MNEAVPHSSAVGGGAWLFSRRADLGVFVGSFALSIAMLAVGKATGALGGDTPGWAWVPAILMVDVAHVWATGYRTYFDPRELRRRPVLYAGVPAASFAVLSLVYRIGGGAFFWRALAYLAIAHFVRQQYGWVMLYRARAKEREGKLADTIAIYAATIWPLVYWHAHAPRRFDWFVPGDVVRAPAWIAAATFPFYAFALALYGVRAFVAWRAGRGNPGKDTVVATTAAAWLVGVVLLDSDYAFTVTNVFIHGIPYLALVYFYRRGKVERERAAPDLFSRIVFFVGLLWLIAYAEELAWDRAIWQERPWLFGAPWEVGAWKALIVPLLALPQTTHYVLDAFLWKRRTNPDVSRMLREAT
ncbi:MAG TPA: hypothetical protein VGH28_21785 [Polyangiaceae bacterium]|jgi:hypothetical protein